MVIKEEPLLATTNVVVRTVPCPSRSGWLAVTFARVRHDVQARANVCIRSNTNDISM